MGWFDLDAGIAYLAGEAKAAAENAINARKHGAAKAAEIRQQKFLEVEARHRRERRSAAKWMVVLTSPITLLLAFVYVPAGGWGVCVPFFVVAFIYGLARIPWVYKWQHNPYK